MPSPGYRSRVPRLLLIIVAILVLSGYVAFRQSLSMTSQFVFLYVRETNNALLTGGPAGPVTADFPEWSSNEPQLTLPDGKATPPPNTRVVMLREVEHYDVLVEGRTEYYSRTPATLPIADAVAWQDGAFDAAGPVADRLPVVNSARFVPSNVSLQSIDNDGTVTLTVDGEPIRLAPGETWAVASGPVAGEVQRVHDGPDWQPFITAQLDQSLPLTVLTVHNLGLMNRIAVTKRAGGTSQ